jgi:diguanylate cyclase (GGDEF)-like protein
VLVAHDVTAARELSDKLARLALHDHLTGLPNRRLFADRLNQAIGLAKRAATCFALLYIDLDNFKEVNDAFGHQVGDQLLQKAAERLLRCVRDSDTVCRQGGDEFSALLINCGDVNASAICAQKIVDTLGAAYTIDGKQLTISASLGIALYPVDATDPRSLIRAADTAMYQAKCAGRGRYERFSSQ